MLNVVQVLTRLKINPESRLQAVQDIRQLVEGSENPLGAAKVIIANFISDMNEFDCNDPIEARMTAQYLVDNAMILGDKFNAAEQLEAAANKIAGFRVTNPWFFYKKEFSTVETKTEIKHDVAVEVKTDGKLKKGGKQVIAQALYAKHKDKDNKSIIELFMKELDMSKAGATTYLYNCKKATT